MNFSVLLRSNIYSQCKRGLRLLNYELENNPRETLQIFPQYCEALISLFFRSQNGSIFHAATTPNLVKFASAFIEKLDDETNYQILCFLIECCRHCLATEHAFYFSLDVYNISFYKDLIQKIFKKSKDSFLKLKLPDIVTLIECETGHQLMSSNIDYICNLIDQNPQYGAETFLKLFLSKHSYTIVNECIKRCCQKNSPMLQYLPTNVAILGSSDKDMEFLLTNHSKIDNPPLAKHFYCESQIIKLCRSPYSVTMKELPEECEKPVAHKYSILVQPTISKLKKIQEDANTICAHIMKSSPFEVVRGLTNVAHRKYKIESVSIKPGDHQFGRIRTQSAILITPKILHAYGVKKGGIAHNTWQKRYFDFYASARCLLWRDNEHSRRIKGVLVLPEYTRVTPNLSHKNYPYILVIEPGDEHKKYSIAFEKETVCNQFCQALQSVSTGYVA